MYTSCRQSGACSSTVPFNDVADLLACAMLLVLIGTIFGIFESPEECVLDFDDMKVYTRYESSAMHCTIVAARH
jgi:hypothetical protein